MSQAVKSTLPLHADDSCILYQHKEVDEIEKHLNKDFENICGWLVDNKLYILARTRLNRFFLQLIKDQRMSVC